ncbi:MAG: NAD(P)/FAD-dependent oxidoreductase [Lachnospiraceae bacterium]|nr:NAD(P)/FAD-dependent oxidoreductase [Lachnospiraceae bacterium]
MRRVLVIGGGASGLMAAITAARQGAKVTLIEKNQQPGKKLLTTGNGRCNFTNRRQELSFYRSEDPERVREVLRAFPAEAAVAFFEELGILVKDRNGYLYPNSGQASSMVEVLKLEVRKFSRRIKEAYNTEVLSVEKQRDVFRVHTEGWTYEGDALILACGSKAGPKTGSTGDGYRFAESLGHRVIPPLPALTGLYASEGDRGTLAGVRIEAKVTLFIDGQISAEEEGEVQFASYGLSGIPVFQVSRYVSRAREAGRDCMAVLDVCPGYSLEELEKILLKKGVTMGERKGTDILLGMFPEKLSQVFLGRAGISLKKPRRDWTEGECRRLAEQMKGLSFHIFGCRGYEQAQVCTGGVPLSELKGVSMESILVPGLYFAGELLDVDGACGGYNLQWAWSSGYLAGVHAAGFR